MTTATAAAAASATAAAQIRRRSEADHVGGWAHGRFQSGRQDQQFGGVVARGIFRRRKILGFLPRFPFRNAKIERLIVVGGFEVRRRRLAVDFGTDHRRRRRFRYRRRAGV